MTRPRQLPIAAARVGYQLFNIASRGDPAGRRVLAVEYLRLKAKQTLGRPGGPGRETILGMQLSYIEYGWLVHMFEEIFVDRHYDVPLENAAPYIVDCGSNIGMSVLFFKRRFPAARVLAFEPEPQAFECLRANVEGNRLSDVEITHAAVTGRDGVAPFNFAAGSPISSVAAYRGLATTNAVRSVSLARRLDGPVDLLKLDVEGAEAAVLEDLAERGRLRSIRTIVLEYHHHLEADEDRLGALLALLEQAGYGYQLQTRFRPPWSARTFQDVLVYAYRKDDV